ncbi:MAG: 4Fe-4S binding protein [Lentisphaeria bacterium]|nr:MAG: 4Fe-4S binding protein [Lentisphaeria bacterium]
MNLHFPVFTTENICHDCYKCIRHCPCKAIRIVDGRAGVIQELCVACGMCVKVCPAHAKKIRPDLARARYLLGTGKRSMPRWRPRLSAISAMCRGVPWWRRSSGSDLPESARPRSALRWSVRKPERFSPRRSRGVYLSSACPAVVDFVRKYAPDYAKNVVPVLSPVLTHTKILRQTFGDEIGVVFFGPCVAKKNESDRHQELLDLALTFADLEEWLTEEGIDPASINPSDYQNMVPESAEEGRVYAIEGGMNDTLRAPSADIRYLAVSGLVNLNRLLCEDPEAANSKACKIFIECLACPGGCVNGPVMPARQGGTLGAVIEVAREYDGNNSLARPTDLPIEEPVHAEPEIAPEVTEEQLRNALASVGKFTPADELNCGGCGYFSCRDFARALVANKAEVEMCVSHLRQLAQKKSNALIRYIPAGVVIVDRHLRIVECNRRFAELFDEDTVLAYDSCGGLTGAGTERLRRFQRSDGGGVAFRRGG